MDVILRIIDHRAKVDAAKDKTAAKDGVLALDLSKAEPEPNYLPLNLPLQVGQSKSAGDDSFINFTTKRRKEFYAHRYDQ